MSQVVVFGTSQWAELSDVYLTHDSPHEVVGFTVDGEYMDGAEFRGRPVVPWEEIATERPPGDFALFLPISFKRMNHLRAERFAAAKEMGYEVVSYVSSKASTFPGFSCGDNCFIQEDNTIQPFVEIGDDVVMWAGNHIGHHTRIGDHVMITSHVVISGVCEVGDYSFFGVNATVRDETVIGHDSLIGMGVSILADTEPYSVYKAVGAEPAGFRSDEIRSLSHKSKG
jgi:sugar O-acyltransferase (sialic acid O-acetyltransferase NeuD family)